jgi:hypothetical protein
MAVITDILREEARWRKEKTPVVAKYLAEHNKLLDEIAGRGFLALPGYAYDLENDLELGTKLGLAEVNYKILEETIDRELKQMGIDYNLTYRNAVMAWQLQKQALEAAWAAEYAVMQQGMMTDENTLNLLADEVHRRELILMSSKLALDLETETDRKALVDLEGETSPYETQLVQAKMLVAQKKLEIIPILQEIVAKEQSLLAEEQLKAAEYSTYMAAEQALMAKKETLVPILAQLSALTNTYTNDILNIEIPDITLISAEKVKQANIAIQKATYQVQELTVEIDTEAKQLTLMDAKRALQVIQFTNEESLITTSVSLDTTYHLDEMAEFETVFAEEGSAETNILADRLAVHKSELATKLTSMGTITTQEEREEYDKTQLAIREIHDKAALDAAPKITGALT